MKKIYRIEYELMGEPKVHDCPSKSEAFSLVNIWLEYGKTVTIKKATKEELSEHGQWKKMLELAKFYEIDLCADRNDVIEELQYQMSVSENDKRTKDLLTMLTYIKNKKGLKP